MNETIFYFFYNFAHQSVVLDKVIVFFAVYFPYLVVIAAGVFLLMHHEVFKEDNTWQVVLEKKKEILKFIFSGFFAYVAALILKNLLQFPRPFLVFHDVYPLLAKSTFAFPSEHASIFSALAFSIFFLHKKAGYMFIFFALLIGLARVLAGVHSPVDILAGFVLGAVVAFFLRFI